MERKPNNLKVFDCKKTKGYKQDCQNRERSPMTEGGEITYINYNKGSDYMVLTAYQYPDIIFQSIQKQKRK